MFERYSEAARRTIFFARAEANQRGSHFIEPEHFLLGLLREDKDVVAGYLKDKAEVDAVCREIEDALPVLGPQLPSPDIPLSHALKRVLAYGAEEAERLHHRRIGIEHHVLGLLREQSVAARILETHGVTIESGRAYVRQNWKDEVPDRKPDREHLHSLIDVIPAGALPQAFLVLQQLRSWGQVQMPPQKAGMNLQVSSRGHLPEGHVSSSSRMDGDTLVVETHRVFRSHELTKIEWLSLSIDGKTLHYAIEFRSAKQHRELGFDLDLS